MCQCVDYAAICDVRNILGCLPYLVACRHEEFLLIRLLQVAPSAYLACARVETYNIEGNFCCIKCNIVHAEVQ
jgi:hypothetical protein